MTMNLVFITVMFENNNKSVSLKIVSVIIHVLFLPLVY